MIFPTDPTHERAVENVNFFGSELKKSQATGSLGDTGTLDHANEPLFKRRKEREHFHRTKAFQDYEKLCRGQVRNLVR